MSLTAAIICVSSIAVLNVIMIILKRDEISNSIENNLEIIKEVIISAIFAFVGLMGIIYLYKFNQVYSIVSFFIWLLAVVATFRIIQHHYYFDENGDPKERH